MNSPPERYPLLGQRTFEWPRGASQWCLKAFDGDLETLTAGGFAGTHPLALLRCDEAKRLLGGSFALHEAAIDCGPFERHVVGGVRAVDAALNDRIDQLTDMIAKFVADSSRTGALLARAALLWRDSCILLKLWMDRVGRTLGHSAIEFRRGALRYAPRTDTVMHVGREPSIGAALHDCSFLLGHGTPLDEFDAMLRQRALVATRRGRTVRRDRFQVFGAHSRHIDVNDADHLAAAITRLSVRAVPVHTPRHDLLPLLRRQCADDVRVIDWLRVTLALVLLDAFPPTDDLSAPPQTLDFDTRCEIYATCFSVSAELPEAANERAPLAMDADACAEFDPKDGSQTWATYHNQLRHDREALLSLEYAGRTTKRRHTSASASAPTPTPTPSDATTLPTTRSDVSDDVVERMLSGRSGEVGMTVRSAREHPVHSDRHTRKDLVYDAAKAPLKRETNSATAAAALSLDIREIGQRRFAEYERWFAWLTLTAVGRRRDSSTLQRFAVNQRAIATAVCAHFVYVLRTQEIPLRGELVRRAAVHWPQHQPANRRRWVRWETFTTACARQLREHFSNASGRVLERLAFVQRRARGWPRSPVLLAIASRPPNFNTALHAALRRVLVGHPVTTTKPANGVRRVSDTTESILQLIIDARHPVTQKRLYAPGNELLPATDDPPPNEAPTDAQWNYLIELAAKRPDGEECQSFPASLFFSKPVIGMYLAARTEFHRLDKTAPLQRLVESLADAGDTYHLQMLFVFNRTNMAHCAVRRAPLSWIATASQMAALRARHLGVPPPHIHAAPLPRLTVEAMTRRWYACDTHQSNYNFQPFPRVSEPPLPTHQLCTMVCLRCSTLAAVTMPSTSAERSAMPSKLATAPETEVGAVRTMMVNQTPFDDFATALRDAQIRWPNSPERWLSHIATAAGPSAALPVRSLLDALDLRAQVPAYEQSPDGLIVLLGRRSGEEEYRVAFHEHKLREVWMKQLQPPIVFDPFSQPLVPAEPVIDPISTWRVRVADAIRDAPRALVNDLDTVVMRLWRRASADLAGQRHLFGYRALHIDGLTRSADNEPLESAVWVCAARRQTVHALGHGASGSSANKRRRAAEANRSDGEQLMTNASEYMGGGGGDEDDFGLADVQSVRDSQSIGQTRSKPTIVRAAKRLAMTTNTTTAAAAAAAATNSATMRRALAAPPPPTETIVDRERRRVREAQEVERIGVAKAATERARTMVSFFAHELRLGRMTRTVAEVCVGVVLHLQHVDVQAMRVDDVWDALNTVLHQSLQHAGTGSDPATSTLGVDMSELRAASGAVLNDRVARLARQVVEAATRADCKRHTLIAVNMLGTTLRFADGRTLALCTMCLNRMYLGPEAWAFGTFACSVCRTGVVPPRMGPLRKLGSAAAATHRSVVACMRAARRVQRRTPPTLSAVASRARAVLRPGIPAQALRAFHTTRYYESSNTDDYTGQPMCNEELALPTQYRETVPGDLAMMLALRERSAQAARRGAIDRLQSVPSTALFRPATLDPHPWAAPPDGTPRCAACDSPAGTRSMCAYMINDQGCDIPSIADPWSNAFRDVGTLQRISLCPSDRWTTRVARRVPVPLRISVVRTAVGYAQKCQTRMRAAARRRRMRDGATPTEAATAAAQDENEFDDVMNSDDEVTIPKKTTLFRPMLFRYILYSIRADVAVSLAQEEQEKKDAREALRRKRKKKKGGNADDDDDNSADDAELYATNDQLAAFDVDPGADMSNAVFVFQLAQHMQDTTTTEQE